MYSTGFTQRSCLVMLSPLACAYYKYSWQCFARVAIHWMALPQTRLIATSKHTVGRQHIELWWLIDCDSLIYSSTFLAWHPLSIFWYGIKANCDWYINSRVVRKIIPCGIVLYWFGLWNKMFKISVYYLHAKFAGWMKRWLSSGNN